MPKLWNESIDAHRAAVQGAVLDATAELVAERGLVALTMSRIAERAGIGRATLYKYFPDVRAIVAAWHERQIATHLEQLTAAADPDDAPAARLKAVLLMYARIQRHSGDHETDDPARSLHEGDHVDRARRSLHAFVRDLLAACADAGDVRDDIAVDELATYCLHALAAARTVPAREGAERLVTLTLAGLRPPGP